MAVVGLARRAAASACARGRRLTEDVADAFAAGRRGLRRASGTVIELRPADGGAVTPTPLPARLPLPAPRAHMRALTGSRMPSLDAFAPRGPHLDVAPPMLLVPVGGLDPGAWRTDEAIAFASAVVRRGAAPPSVVLAAEDRDLPALRTRLRRLPRPARRRLVIGAAPDAAALDGLLTTVDAVVLPRHGAASATLLDGAAARGRAVVEPETAGADASELLDLGRAARLEFARRQTPPRPWAESAPAARVVHESRRVVVAGHDLKFAQGLIQHLRATGHEVRVDPWRGHARHDDEHSRSLAHWADVVHCEWSLGNLVWHSRHVPAGTRLTSRLHLQEAATPFPGRAARDAIDSWIFVAPHVRDQVLRDTGFPSARAPWIPNVVASPAGASPSAGTDRRFVLGLVGVLPERKGLHRALDTLRRLRAVEPRYTLRIRGHRPGDVAWMSSRPQARAYYAEQDEQIARDPSLAGAVTWDPHGPDMASWYARVGVALSTSDFESFHFTLPDGAVHGCVPRSLAWAGADVLYPPHWLAPTTEELAASIRAVTLDEPAWRAAASEARDVIAGTYDEAVVLPRLAAAVLGGPTS